jgi:8-oxo-dGTP pyrophosphatase MutT (NUDIX family)
MASSDAFIPQAAALPMRSGRVCLVMSRDGKRWVIPKGHVEVGHTPAETALQEAWEEAGLVGALERHPVGSYVYEKRGSVYHVVVYRMEVTGVADRWPEPERGRRWVTPERALKLVTDPGLRRLLSEIFPTAARPAPAEVLDDLA